MTYRDNIVGILEALSDLPAISAVVYEVERVLARPSASADDVGRIISKDQSLTARMLRLANSAYYGLVRRVSTVSAAVTVLGFDRVRSVTLASSVFDALSRSGRRDLHLPLWQHSIVTASLCQTLAARTGLLDPEELFVAGLLHDVGKLVFEVLLPAEYRACRASVSETVTLLEAETEQMGLTHAELGARLLIHWNLPIALSVAAAGHHSPRRGLDYSLVISVVHVANAAAHAAGVAAGDPFARPAQWDQVSELTPVRESTFGELVAAAQEENSRAEHFIASFIA